MTSRFLQEFNDHEILVIFFQSLIRILQKIVKNTSIRKLDRYGILVNFSQNLIRFIFNNSFGILQLFRSEFRWPALLFKNLNDYEILRELDDHRIIVQLFLNLIRLVQELDVHRINMKICNDFDQNSGGQPNYSIILMTMKF